MECSRGAQVRSAVKSEFHRTGGAGRAGLKEFGILDAEERLKRYRRYVYEAGALDHPQKGQGRVIKNDMVEHERKNDFELNRIRRFRYRTRYFTDSGNYRYQIICL